MVDNVTTDVRARIMAQVKGKNTKPEQLLRSALWKEGIRGWRKNYKTVIGTPDIVFTKKRLTIFVDGHFNQSLSR